MSAAPGPRERPRPRDPRRREVRIIAGEWGGRRLAPLRGRGIRPTTDRVREAWMSAMGGDFTGLRALDLFAGSGALGLELLSRGAEHVTFVERAPASLRVLRQNVGSVGAEGRASVVSSDVFRFLSESLETASVPDLALADPPYQSGASARLVEAFLRAPFAQTLWVEHASREALPDVPGLRQRRYGDTTLSALTRSP
ncbi:MAG: 16S rRNA (guanine(966)-N(2))-methyltransferase RsmD [Gemmatimonadota bacterium]